ncbi:MAG TPA: hypothetical protein VFF23_05150 [Hanamia sp.]|nr:hypothetical protein [Hanamia sp.]
MNRKKNFALFLALLSICFILFSFSERKPRFTSTDNAPKIVNIINFIRLTEPRDANITEEVLYQTVVSQIDIMRKYKLKGTFLLQYDALMDIRYQKLLKKLPSDSFDIGAWWEMPRPFVLDAGLKWRGNSSWDPRADVDFATGYSIEERKKLADTYMKQFKKIFGHYPSSVGSWFIDAYTLNYLYKQYGIVASCNCKDQIGTDGYTLWGGYWNQAYYPSRKNAYMPAQNAANQIPVPIFRMLGSDPVRQYDNGVGKERQGVVTLEPVYKFGGGDSAWVHWYFNQFTQGECLNYAYVQAGQENSFTWEAMKKGFNIQLPLIAKLRDENKIKVETLAESGKWFLRNFKVTPPTSVTVNNDVKNDDVQTVWYDSRFYRANLLWENGTLRFRDIHLFNENLASSYLTQKSTSTKASFFTLPFVDGNKWSSTQMLAGMAFKAMVNGKEILIKGEKPKISGAGNQLHISWPITSFDGMIIMDLDEENIKIQFTGKESINWFLELTTASGAVLPFKKISPHQIDAEFEGMKYSINAKSGSFANASAKAVLTIQPENNQIGLKLNTLR